MGRPLRAAEGGYVYHVLNRANARMTIFDDDQDYEAFETVLAQAVKRTKAVRKVPDTFSSRMRNSSTPGRTA